MEVASYHIHIQIRLNSLTLKTIMSVRTANLMLYVCENPMQDPMVPVLAAGTCSVRDHPEVWQCVLRRRDLAILGWKFFLISVAQSRRPARSLAISM